MKLIVNADDFGTTKGVSYGIIDGYRNGIIRSTTMMCNGLHVEHAAKLAKEYPELGVGVHLVLTSGKPLTQGKSFVNEQGNFYTLAENRFDSYDIKEVETELEAQIQRFLSTGLKPTHFDAHHNMQSLQCFTPLFVKLALKYNVPMRRLTKPYTNTEAFADEQKKQKRLENVKHTEVIYKDFYGEAATIDTLLTVLEDLVSSGYQTAESFAHPGFVEPELIAKSSYNMQRVQELNALTAPEVLAKVEELRIELIHYGAL